MISVIVSIYNKEKYIEKCINSILKQQYSDCELILVDDGSTDNSLKICNQFADKYQNIVVLHQDNSGVSVARNNGIKHSSGDWISFVDPDDYIDSELFKILISESKGFDIVSCCCYAFDKNSKYLNQFYANDRNFLDERDKNDLYCQLLFDKYEQPGSTYTAIGVPWGKIYRASLIKDNHLMFNKKLKRQQDNAFNMHAFAAALGVKYINKPLYFYRLDNVVNYYVSKYDSYAALNAIELQNERYIFFVLGNRLDCKKIKNIYYNETVCVIFGALNKCILNRNNCFSYRERKQKFISLILNDCFSSAIRESNPYIINGMLHKVALILFKMKMFFPLSAIWKFRVIYEKIKFG